MSQKKLTIAQALRRRKQLKGAIATHTQRVSEALVYEKKNQPTFSFEDSNNGLRAARFELISIEDAIARKNATTFIEFKGEKVALTWALRTLSEIKGEIARYETYEHRGLRAQRETEEKTMEAIAGQIITTTQPDGSTTREYAKQEVTRIFISNITERERADKMDQLQQEFEVLNDLLEAANHNTVIEYQDQPEKDKADGEATQTP